MKYQPWHRASEAQTDPDPNQGTAHSDQKALEDAVDTQETPELGDIVVVDDQKLLFKIDCWLMPILSAKHQPLKSLPKLVLTLIQLHHLCLAIHRQDYLILCSCFWAGECLNPFQNSRHIGSQHRAF